MIWIAFAVGLFVGFAAGYLAHGLLGMAGERRRGPGGNSVDGT